MVEYTLFALFLSFFTLSDVLRSDLGDVGTKEGYGLNEDIYLQNPSRRSRRRNLRFLVINDIFRVQKKLPFRQRIRIWKPRVSLVLEHRPTVV